MKWTPSQIVFRNVIIQALVLQLKPVSFANAECSKSWLESVWRYLVSSYRYQIILFLDDDITLVPANECQYRHI